MPKMKWAELKKYKIEYEVSQNLKALSGNSGPSSFQRRVQNSMIFQRNILAQAGSNMLKEDIKLVVMGKPGLQKPEDSMLKITS